MYKNVYLSFIYNSVIVETNNMPNNEWLVKKNYDISTYRYSMTKILMGNRDYLDILVVRLNLIFY